ncbi:DUF6093 family protein [Streptomyces luteolus]|uniref:DUF6093 family protein n=1 Tax=Streptomyces luteolus TaxID=3043615 RepID=A0ABT6SQU9_9ACTN|nr:DUF6093 family protein [Streptomyces sp. B-S-A12]MDI3417971.1 DUF6093 family protein [Streptomyces sp. B-S-A12]
MEGVLEDRLELWRDVQGESDDVLDEDSGQLMPVEGTPFLVWDGLGAVTLAGQLSGAKAALDGVAAGEVSQSPYQAMVPVDAPPTRPGDVLVVAGSTRDPQLMGRRFRVVDYGLGSYAVVRLIRLQLL